METERPEKLNITELVERLRTLRSAVADVDAAMPSWKPAVGIGRRALDDLDTVLDLTEDAAAAAVRWLRDDAPAFIANGRE